MKDFKNLFIQWFQKGLPTLWDENGRLITQEQHHPLLTQALMDHLKFKYIENDLDRRTIVNKLTDDFEILSQFNIIKAKLPPISYASCIDSEVLIMEMMDCHIPFEKQWKEVKRLGRTKYKLPTEN